MEYTQSMQQQPRLLVVSDDAQVREDVGAMYREWGWDVRLADCPWQACTVAANESLDLIVCDCETQPGELFTGCALRELGTQMPPVLMLSEEPHYVPLTQRHSRLRTVDRAYTPESLARESSACLYVLRRPEE